MSGRDVAGGIVIAEAAGATVVRWTAAGFSGVGVGDPEGVPTAARALEEVGSRLEDVVR
jgi:hypothetical protein